MLSDYFFYLLFLFKGFSFSANISAAFSSAACIAWEYIFVVVETLACPNLFDTVGMFTPFAISSEAFVCPYGIIKTKGKSPYLQGF